MIGFIRILLIVYALAINVYAFTLLYTQKKHFIESGEKKISDGKILLAALLGGAIGVYIGTFALSYRKESLFYMVLIPLVIAFYIYFVFMGFYSNFLGL